MSGICKGLTPLALTKKLAISRETVRSQLKSVLMKTGAKRQAELIMVLSSHQLTLELDEASFGSTSAAADLRRRA